MKNNVNKKTKTCELNYFTPSLPRILFHCASSVFITNFEKVFLRYASILSFWRLEICFEEKSIIQQRFLYRNIFTNSIRKGIFSRMKFPLVFFFQHHIRPFQGGLTHRDYYNSLEIVSSVEILLLYVLPLKKQSICSKVRKS